MFVTTNANATLIVDISGSIGSGETSLSFSGSSTVTSGSNSFVASDGDGDGGAWFSFGDYIKTINNTNVAIIGGTASVGVNSDFADIVSIYLDQDGDGLDDWGFRIAGADLAVTLNDVISWSGSVDIGVDIAEFNVGNYSTNDFGFGDATADVIMNVTTTSVSEAPALALFFIGLIGLLRVRK